MIKQFYQTDMQITRQTKSTLTLLHVPRQSLGTASAASILVGIGLSAVSSALDLSEIVFLIPLAIAGIFIFQSRIGSRVTFNNETKTAQIRHTFGFRSHLTTYDISWPCRVIVEKRLRDIKNDDSAYERTAFETRMKLAVLSGQSEGVFLMHQNFIETRETYEIARQVNDWLDSPAPRT